MHYCEKVENPTTHRGSISHTRNARIRTIAKHWGSSEQKVETWLFVIVLLLRLPRDLIECVFFDVALDVLIRMHAAL